MQRTSWLLIGMEAASSLIMSFSRAMLTQPLDSSITQQQLSRPFSVNFSYLPNTVYLHSDASFMPQRRGAWASWVYRSDQEEDKSSVVSLSYWMNNLQPLETDEPIIATLNPGCEPDPALTHDVHTFQHPMFDSAAMDAQSRIS